MPQTSLRCKHLLEFDDINQAYKRARLMKYLHDAITSNHEAESNTFNAFSFSGNFSISSSSSISSGSDSDTSLSVTPSEEEYLKAVEEEIRELRERITLITISGVLRRRFKVPKPSQNHLIMAWRDGNIDKFRCKVCMDPSTFDGILEKIHNHHIFHSNSSVSQIPVEAQLAIFLYYPGHYGNAADPKAIGCWTGVSLGTVVNATNCVMVALLAMHDGLIHLPTSMGGWEGLYRVECWVPCDGWCQVYIVPVAQPL
jgi:hypothetical protein